jgi:hypothetical protein
MEGAGNRFASKPSAKLMLILQIPKKIRRNFVILQPDRRRICGCERNSLSAGRQKLRFCTQQLAKRSPHTKKRLKGKEIIAER